MGMRRYFLELLSFIIICLNLNIVTIRAEDQIKFKNDVYFSLPQIRPSYSIVNENKLGSDLVTKNSSTKQSLSQQRFSRKQNTDYFVGKATEPDYQAKKNQQMTGKNIFTPQYIESHISDTLKQLQNKNNADIQKTKVSPVVQERQVVDDKTKEQKIIEQKSNQLYGQFKNLQVLREKSLKDLLADESKDQSTKNFYKLIGYITVGLILSFAIIKKATKKEPSLPKKSEEKTQLRLRDTIEDEEDESNSSSEESN